MASKTEYPEINEKFTLLQNADDPSEGDHFDFEQTKKYPLRQVWTVVEGDTDGWWCLTGYHVVNRLFYLVSEQEWTDADAEIDYQY